ncbi:hypothetical protein BGZ93_001117, partial [Podila epicladia]
ASLPSKCMFLSIIKEYRPFRLLTHSPVSVVSKIDTTKYLVGGVPDVTMPQPDAAIFCFVTTDNECTTWNATHTDCVHGNIEYRVRVTDPPSIKGYLHVVEPFVEIVPTFEESSGFYLFENTGIGMRLAHVFPVDRAYALTNKGPEHPLTFERLAWGDEHQDFEMQLAKDER